MSVRTSAARLPPLNGLRAFEAAARHLNFRLAAEELSVTQAAVAQQVRGLEAYLGVKLFERLPRRLALTEQGRACAPEVRRAFELLVEATQSVRPAPERLTLSVTPTFAAKWLIPRLPEFVEAHPFVELRILASEKISDFRHDDVDIAVRQGRPPFGSDLESWLLFPQELVAVCSPALLPEDGSWLSLADLGERVLLQDAHDPWPRYLKETYGVRVPEVAKKLRFNQTSLAIDAALAGQGVALVSRFLVEPELRASRLVQAMQGTLRGMADFHVVVPRSPQRRESTRMVRDWLLAQRTQA